MIGDALFFLVVALATVWIIWVASDAVRIFEDLVERARERTS